MNKVPSARAMAADDDDDGHGQSSDSWTCTRRRMEGVFMTFSTSCHEWWCVDTLAPSPPPPFTERYATNLVAHKSLLLLLLNVCTWCSDHDKDHHLHFMSSPFLPFSSLGNKKNEEERKKKREEIKWKVDPVDQLPSILQFTSHLLLVFYCLTCSSWFPCSQFTLNLPHHVCWWRWGWKWGARGERGESLSLKLWEAGNETFKNSG